MRSKECGMGKRNDNATCMRPKGHKGLHEWYDGFGNGDVEWGKDQEAPAVRLGDVIEDMLKPHQCKNPDCHCAALRVRNEEYEAALVKIRDWYTLGTGAGVRPDEIARAVLHEGKEEGRDGE